MIRMFIALTHCVVYGGSGTVIAPHPEIPWGNCHHARCADPTPGNNLFTFLVQPITRRFTSRRTRTAVAGAVFAGVTYITNSIAALRWDTHITEADLVHVTVPADTTTTVVSTGFSNAIWYALANTIFAANILFRTGATVPIAGVTPALLLFTLWKATYIIVVTNLGRIDTACTITFPVVTETESDKAGFGCTTHPAAPSTAIIAARNTGAIWNAEPTDSVDARSCSSVAGPALVPGDVVAADARDTLIIGALVPVVAVQDPAGDTDAAIAVVLGRAGIVVITGALDVGVDAALCRVTDHISTGVGFAHQGHPGEALAALALVIVRTKVPVVTGRPVHGRGLVGAGPVTVTGSTVRCLALFGLVALVSGPCAGPVGADVRVRAVVVVVAGVGVRCVHAARGRITGVVRAGVVVPASNGVPVLALPVLAQLA